MKRLHWPGFLVTLLLLLAVTPVSYADQAQRIYMPTVTVGTPARQSPLGMIGIQASPGTSPQLIASLPSYGVSWIRLANVRWEYLQPTPESPFQWQRLAGFEAQLLAASQAGLQVQVVLTNPPRWATITPSSCAMVRPEFRDEFANYVREMVKRYSVPPYNVKVWSIGNEPDLDPRLIEADAGIGCWGNYDDPLYGGGDYAELLKVVAPVVRASDPNAIIVAGALLLDRPYNPALGNDPQNLAGRFLEGFVAAAASSYDFLSFHTYSWYVGGPQTYALRPEWAAWGSDERAKINYVRTLMRNASVEKPLLVDETALLCTFRGVVCQEAQAVYFTRTLVRHLSSGIQSIGWYSVDDVGFYNSNAFDSLTGAPLAPMFAMRTAQQQLGNASYIGPLTAQASGMEGALFRRGAATVIVHWSEPNASLSVPIKPGAAATCTSLKGEPISCVDSDNDGVLVVPSTAQPAYVLITDANKR